MHELAMYKRMLTIRRFEEAVIAEHRRGRIPGPVHVSIGQEATVVGACAAARPDDYMTGNHRSHGHPIAKGASLDRLMAELFGRETGICGGRGGSMHLADFSVGSLGESGIVGSAIPVAVGAAFSARLRRSKQVCICFFGDGAINTGAFHEGVNLATVWRLPVVFVCENNGYAVTTPSDAVTAGNDLVARALSYGMPAELVDGQDVLAVHQSVAGAIERARAGQGPSLVESVTYRYHDHAQVGPFSKKLNQYRPPAEVEAWKERDPVKISRARILQTGSVHLTDVEAIEDEVDAQVAAALRFALESPYPDPASVVDNVFTAVR